MLYNRCDGYIVIDNNPLNETIFFCCLNKSVQHVNRAEDVCGSGCLKHSMELRRCICGMNADRDVIIEGTGKVGDNPFIP